MPRRLSDHARYMMTISMQRRSDALHACADHFHSLASLVKVDEPFMSREYKERAKGDRKSAIEITLTLRRMQNQGFAMTDWEVGSYQDMLRRRPRRQALEDRFLRSLVGEPDACEASPDFPIQ